jgi:hypothetical protein
MAQEFVGAEVLVNEGAGWGSCGVGRVMWQQADGGRQRLIVVGPGETVLASADLPDKAVRFSLSSGTVLRVLPMESAEWALSFSSADDAAQVWEDVNMLYGAEEASPGSPMFGIGDDSFALPAEVPDPTTEGGLEQLEAMLALLHGVARDDLARVSLIQTMASSEPFATVSTATGGSATGGAGVSGSGGPLVSGSGGRPLDFLGTLAAAYAEHEARLAAAARTRQHGSSAFHSCAGAYGEDRSTISRLEAAERARQGGSSPFQLSAGACSDTRGTISIATEAAHQGGSPLHPSAGACSEDSSATSGAMGGAADAATDGDDACMDVCGDSACVDAGAASSDDEPEVEAASGRFGRIAKMLLTLEEGSLLRRILRDDAAPFLFGALEYEARVSFVLKHWLCPWSSPLSVGLYSGPFLSKFCFRAPFLSLAPVPAQGLSPPPPPSDIPLPLLHSRLAGAIWRLFT